MELIFELKKLMSFLLIDFRKQKSFYIQLGLYATL